MPSSLQLQQAMYQIPTQNQYAGGMNTFQGQQIQQEQQMPFQGGGQTITPQEGGGFSFGKILLAATIGIAAIAGHKANQARNAMKEAGVVTEKIPSLFKTAKEFINPMNWFKNGAAKESVEKLGLTATENKQVFIDANKNPFFLMGGKKVINASTGKVEEAFTNTLNKIEPKLTDAEKLAANESKIAKAPPIKLSADETVLIRKQQEIKSEISTIKEQMGQITDKQSQAYKNLELKLTGQKALLQTDEMKAVNSKLKELKKQRAEFKSDENLSLADRVSKRRTDVQKLKAEKNLNLKIMQENIKKTTEEIKKDIFGGNEIKKAVPKKKALSRESTAINEANQKNQAKIEQLDEMMIQAENDFRAITNPTSAEALALQDRMYTIEEVIKLLK